MMWTHGSRSVLVTCGSVIKLRHESTGYHLHSHTIKWGGGSGQQSVTAHGSEDDQGSMWLVSSISMARTDVRKQQFRALADGRLDVIDGRLDVITAHTKNQW